MTDIQNTTDFGHDETWVEDFVISDVPAPPGGLQSSAMVDANHLPPIADQTTPSCFVWSTAYVGVGYAAAVNGQYSPSTAANQPSVAYTYIKVLLERKEPVNTCVGGTMGSVLVRLRDFDGTPTEAVAPTPAGCDSAWGPYGEGKKKPCDNRFQVQSWKGLNSQDPVQIKNALAQNVPVIFCSKIYQDFSAYRGKTDPYVGSNAPEGHFVYVKGTTTLAGHCMAIIGYDDEHPGGGAFYVQNSFGTGWGADGYVWWEYGSLMASIDAKGVFILPEDVGPPTDGGPA